MQYHQLLSIKTTLARAHLCLMLLSLLQNLWMKTHLLKKKNPDNSSVKHMCIHTHMNSDVGHNTLKTFFSFCICLPYFLKLLIVAHTHLLFSAWKNKRRAYYFKVCHVAQVKKTECLCTAFISDTAKHGCQWNNWSLLNAFPFPAPLSPQQRGAVRRPHSTTSTMEELLKRELLTSLGQASQLASGKKKTTFLLCKLDNIYF